MMMEAMRSSETSVLTRATRRHIPEDGILHSRRHHDQKSYTITRNSNITQRSNYVYISTVVAMLLIIKQQHIPLRGS
jgi:hypothetical protein